MAITMEMVKELRAKTSAGVMDCKTALKETNGDMEKAAQFLREKGLATAAKKAGRVAVDGLIHSYIHMGGKIGVLLEVNCETDFVAKTDDFKELLNNIALHIAAMNPQYISREEVSADDLEKERQILTAQARNEGKPEKIVEKMVTGRLEKFYAEKVLLEQPYVKDDSLTIQELISAKIAKIGENIKVRRFARYELGEGLEKKQDNFVEEVLSYKK